MLGNVLELLRLAKQEKISGKYIDIALGKNKMPETIKEAYEQFKKNKKLQSKYNREKSFPTLLALDSSGKIRDRISAYSMLRDTSGYFAFIDKARSIR